MGNVKDFERMKKMLDYDPDSGVFTWKTNPSKRHPLKGKRAGYQKKNGYRRIIFKGVEYLEHRLAWYFVTGEMPRIIDHLDGNPSNNKFCNLENGGIRENGKNRKIGTNNKSGHLGVHFSKKDKSWIARIGRHYIGSFKNKADAISARKEAERLNCYKENHGRRK